MSNPYNNEIIFNGQTLMSLKEDTVTPDKVLAGETFHDRSGAPQTGNLITHNVYDGLDSTSTSDALSANQGRELNAKYSELNSNIKYSTINVNSYSTYASIYNALESKPSLIAIGGIGNQENTNLKTILPNPTGFANYTSVSIKKIGINAMIAIARQLYAQKIAVCYISFGDTGNWYRTDWEIKTTAS